MADPLILTAQMDRESFARLDALRQAHFPDRGYRLPAHLTLFHHLPGADEAAVALHIAAAARRCPPLPLRFEALMPLGRGTAVRAAAPGLRALRAALAAHWAGALTPQDAGGFRPHVTVQNKVSPEVAAASRAAIAAAFAPWEGAATGLILWHYRGGPWEEAGRWRFRAKP